jgi:hypothetical protein
MRRLMRLHVLPPRIPGRPLLMASALVLICAPGAVAQTCVSAADRATVAGRVTDVLTGLPLQGAAVRVYWTAGVDSIREVRTDREGHFETCDVPAGLRVFVRVTFWSTEAAADPVNTEAGESDSAFVRMESPHVRLTGRVTGEDGRTAVEAAAVSVGELDVVTGEDGRFVFERLPPGIWPLTIEHVAYTTIIDSVTVAVGTSTEANVRLAANVIPLDPITVTVRSLYLERTGFYDRRERGMGSNITREEMDRRIPMLASDILRTQPGLRLLRRDAGPGYAVVGRRNCPYRYFVDGTRVGPTFQIDDLPQEWIEAIEIYRGPSSLPPQFQLPPSQVNASCGVILIWTTSRD